MVKDIDGLRVEIDEEDEWLINQFKWHKVENHPGYFVFVLYADGGVYSLHREIMGCIKDDGKIVDHIDCNTLNCKKENLRIVTHRENMMNRKINKNNTTGLKGVCEIKSRNKYKAQIQANGKKINLGLFDTPEEAYASYCEASKKYHGEYGRIA